MQDHQTRARKFAGLKPVKKLTPAQLMENLLYQSYVFQRKECGLSAEGLERMEFPEAHRYEQIYLESLNG